MYRKKYHDFSLVISREITLGEPPHNIK